MPTIVVLRGFRFFFYSNEHLPRHVHVEKDNKTAKFNLEIVEVVKSKKFSASELRTVRELVEENKDAFIKAWDEYFDNK